jgi:hypothetical protein
MFRVAATMSVSSSGCMAVMALGVVFIYSLSLPLCMDAVSE